MNVSLTPELEAFVETKVQSGDFTSASEVVRASLRLLKRQDAEQEATLEALRQAVSEGIAAARAGALRPGGEVFAEIRKRRSIRRRPTE